MALEEDGGRRSVDDGEILAVDEIPTDAVVRIVVATAGGLPVALLEGEVEA